MHHSEIKSEVRQLIAKGTVIWADLERGLFYGRGRT